MDFFAHQEVARRKTVLFVFLFGAAVVTIAIGAYVIIAFAMGHFLQSAGSTNSIWNFKLLIPVSLGVLGVVLVGALTRIGELRSGGHAVAELMGAQRIEPGSPIPLDRRLLNVVEEMAIASGVPVPPVYIMEHEGGINAFAAGFEPGDAVVAVTRGTLDDLNRDELQGVVAHEFSHILNGDMRMNIRLMGLLYGITVIGTIGEMMVRSGGRSRRGRRGGNELALPGAALWLLGSGGTFFASLIRAAVSRQREYLADSSAVQFTRNPEGLSGALKKIGGYHRSHLSNPRRAEIAHMLFGAGSSSWLGRLNATHPPLKERIRRIDRSFAPTRKTRAGGERKHPGSGSAPRTDPRAASFAGVANTRSAIDAIGDPGDGHFLYAEKLLAGIRSEVIDAARNPFQARAVLYILLLSDNESIRGQQLAHLAEHADPKAYEETLELFGEAQRIAPAARLPLLDLAIPALRELSPAQYRPFIANATQLLESVEDTGLFYWTLGIVLRRHLLRQFEKKPRRRSWHSNLRRAKRPAAALLSALAYAGHSDPGQVRAAFDEGTSQLKMRGLDLAIEGSLDLEGLNRTLRSLDGLAPHLKRRILRAAAATISYDGHIEQDEGELFRAIADALGCPVPPLLPGQKLT